MKKRNGITIKIRDGWIKDWREKNAQGTGYYSFLTTQDVKSDGSKNRSPDFENSHRDRNFLSLNECFYYLVLLFDPRIKSIKEQFGGQSSNELDSIEQEIEELMSKSGDAMKDMMESSEDFFDDLFKPKEEPNEGEAKA